MSKVELSRHSHKWYPIISLHPNYNDEVLTDHPGQITDPKILPKSFPHLASLLQSTSIPQQRLWQLERSITERPTIQAVDDVVGRTSIA